MSSFSFEIHPTTKQYDTEDEVSMKDIKFIYVISLRRESVSLKIKPIYDKPDF